MEVVQKLRAWFYRLASTPLPILSASVLSSALTAINKQIDALANDPSEDAIARVRMALQALEEAIEDALWLQQVRDRKAAIGRRARQPDATIAGDEVDLVAAQQARSSAAAHAHKIAMELSANPNMAAEPPGHGR
ncbi:hypothetical protein L3067_04070 [Xanthomonas sp. PPL568]|uniref:hypothetical protein n=1 Tax=Xanthomonas indica TaxID=2912242 RepID=UPI001F59146E|nr:hypothetical protein [Xanthomonas indica]MCI2243783.1 hypothetical protein [Xanthomonas indica]